MNVGDMKRNIKADKRFVSLSNGRAGGEFVGQMFTKAFDTEGTSSLWVGQITKHDTTKDEFTVLYIADRTEVLTTRDEVLALAKEGGATVLVLSTAFNHSWYEGTSLRWSYIGKGYSCSTGKTVVLF